MSKGKVSVENKIYAVNLYLEGKESQHRIASMFDVSLYAVQQWIRNYEFMGVDAFASKKNKKYTKELKEQAVLDYLNGKGSQADICKKHGIRSRSKLQNWIKMYNSHEELKASSTGGSRIMTKGRKTTYEEKIEVVEYCIEHNDNYAETAEKYNVSYQQVYTWMRKYADKGLEGLVDRRGRTKPKEEMTELEQLRLEQRMLQAKIKRQEMEIALLKKLEELERGWD